MVNIALCPLGPVLLNHRDGRGMLGSVGQSAEQRQGQRRMRPARPVGQVDQLGIAILFRASQDDPQRTMGQRC